MNKSPLQETFDYDDLDAVTREFVRQKTDETHGLMKRTAESIIRIGQNLVDVQEHLPEMKFSAWLRAEFALSRQTAYNFMKVATKFGGSCTTVLQLPAKILYELASSSEDIIQQVEKGEVPPTLEAVKAAKEAERQARTEAEASQQQLSAVRQEIQAKQATIEQLTQEITSLQAKLTSLVLPPVEVREVEKFVVPPELEAHVEHLTHQLQTLTQQRDALSQQVTQLRQEARAAALKQNEGGQERRIRLNWYTVTTEFRAAVTKLLAQWPSPIDTMVFEADDWTRLSQTAEMARRFLSACTTLSQGKMVDSTASQTDERTSG